jgi:beta-xylosidase
MMGLDYSALVVKRVGNKFQLQQITCKNADKETAEDCKIIATLDATAKDKIDYQPAIHEDIYMRMNVNAGKCQFAWSSDGKTFHDVGNIFTMKEGKWIGAKIGFVSKEPEGKNNRGWIDVDWFRVTK